MESPLGATEPTRPTKKMRVNKSSDTETSSNIVHRQHRPKRAQVSRACVRCKRLQKGCSDERPCQRCIAADVVDQCVDTWSGPSQNVHYWPRSPPTHSSSTAISSSSQPTPTTPHANFPGQAIPYPQLPRLPPIEVVDFCLDRFFQHLFLTIPILTEDYASSLRIWAESGESEISLVPLGAIVALCAMVMLQVEESDHSSLEDIIHETNKSYGQRLLEDALNIHRCIRQWSNPSFAHVLLTFFIYGSHTCLSHHSRSSFFLRESTTLILLFRPDSEDERARELCKRLFWVLLVSERSHAIRYRRPITLQITLETPMPDNSIPLVGFWNLAALFRPLNTSFIALLNQEEGVESGPPLVPLLARIESAISRAVDHGAELHNTQKANLRITQLWLQIILWQLRLHLGHLSENAHPLSLTYLYPLEVAKDVALSTRDLPIQSIRVHSVGLTEKLFDISCAVVDVLARIPLTQSDNYGIGGTPEDHLRYLRRLITQLPEGSTTYNDLLQKHIQQTLPNMVL